jgi:sulfur-oxidizing protein SoxY
MPDGSRLPRRAVLAALVALPWAAVAQEDALLAAIRELIGGAEPEDGGIALRAPAVAENGAQVPVTVAVESAQTAAEHVTAIHLFATRNPTSGIASFRLTPLVPRAEVQTRIRLAEDQQVIALAQMNDGRVRRAAAQVRVTTGGCLT